jgi:hypothetical protein
MDGTALAAGGGLTAVVMGMAWMVRRLLTGWVSDDRLRQIMPAVVAVLAVLLTLLEGAAGGPLAGPLEPWARLMAGLGVAVTAMGVWSGGKAAIGQS